MKKDNMITVFYDEVTRKDIYRLNGVDVTDTIEMLKDKWERQILDTRCRLFQLDMSIQQRLQEQLTLTEKALELACERVKYFEEMQDREMGHFEFFGYDNEYDLQAIIKQYKEWAKEIMKSD